MHLRAGRARRLRFSCGLVSAPRPTSAAPPAGAVQNAWFKKRKYALGRPPANTRIGDKRIRSVRGRGGNEKKRALLLDHGNFAWGAEGTSQKTRIVSVGYSAANNEFVRTNTLVRGSVVYVDSAPFRNWFEKRYGYIPGATKADQTEAAKGRSARLAEKQAARAAVRGGAVSDIPKDLQDQFSSGRVLEGEEYAFYARKIAARRGKK